MELSIYVILLLKIKMAICCCLSGLDRWRGDCLILYHGTESKESKDDILENGFKICKDGNYGAGIYLTSHFELAQTYTNTGNGYCDDLVIPVRIYNKDIKCLQYRTLAHRLGKECIDNPSFEDALEMPEAEVYCRHNHIKALLIQYDYYDEVVVFDATVIRKIG